MVSLNSGTSEQRVKKAVVGTLQIIIQVQQKIQKREKLYLMNEMESHFLSV